MDNPEFQPPKPRSMPDDELEAALEQAKQQSDGMLAAMMLLEQESQLRAEDEAATSAWLANLKNDPRPEAQLAATNFERSKAGLAPLDSDSEEAELEVVEESFEEIVEGVELEAPTGNSESMPIHSEQSHLVSEPEPIPAPTLEEAAFDELLAMGAAEATSGIDVVPDFSVTDVVGQIVTTVDADFVQAPEEAATALEEVEADSLFEPVAAFSTSTPTQRSSWPSQLSRAVIWSLAVPVIMLFWGASAGVSLSTALVGVSLGTLLAFGLNSIVLKFVARGSQTPSVLSRASFGVYGNLLPSLVNLLFRLIALVLVVSFATTSMSNTIVGLDLSNSWSGFPIVYVAAIVIVLVGLLTSLLPKAFRVWAGAVVFVLFGFWTLFGAIYLRPVAWDFGEVSFGQIVLISVVMVLIRAALSGLNVEQSESSVRARIRVGFEILIPLVVTTVFGAAILAPARGTSTFDLATFAKLVGNSDQWFGTFSNIIGVLVATTISAQLLRFSADALRGFFVPEKISYVLVGLTAVAILMLLGFFAGLGWSVPGLFIFLLAGSTTWTGMIITETILRRQNFHEVSLLRGYGFYRRVSIFATLGFITSLAFAAAVVQVSGIPFFGLAAGYLDSLLVFGELSAPVLGLLFGVVWSLITAVPKIHRQESDIAAIDERKQQIAGIDLPS